MNENLPEEPDEEERDTDEVEKQDADEIEKELLDAMRDLRRKNKKVEEYLDGIARTAEKPAEEKPTEENSGPPAE